jgi:hypothetical protein
LVGLVDEDFDDATNLLGGGGSSSFSFSSVSSSSSSSSWISLTRRFLDRLLLRRFWEVVRSFTVCVRFRLRSSSRRNSSKRAGQFKLASGIHSFAESS